MEHLKQNNRNKNSHEILQGGWIHKFRFEHCYIQEVLTEEQVQKWKHYTPILISSQTGTGKSTFVLKTLCPIIRARGQPVLILCSRIALKKQYKNNTISLFLPDREGDWTEKGLEKEHSFGGVDIYSYQEFHELSKGAKIKEYGAVILDECHFFVNDASFNRNTGEILTKILTTQKTAIRIYMTATPDCVFEEILKWEEKRKSLPMEIRYQTSAYRFYNLAAHEYGE